MIGEDIHGQDCWLVALQAMTSPTLRYWVLEQIGNGRADGPLNLLWQRPEVAGEPPRALDPGDSHLGLAQRRNQTFDVAVNLPVGAGGNSVIGLDCPDKILQCLESAV